jgi:NADH-quinone oxidoreductase subunit F
VSLHGLRERAAAAWRRFVDPERPTVLLGDGTCGRAAGCPDLVAALRARLAGLDVDFVSVGCLGLCYAEPMIEVRMPGGGSVVYAELDADRLARIADGHLRGGAPVAEIAMAVTAGPDIEGIPRFEELTVMKKQVRIVTANCGRIDPTALEHYVACGGLDGLEKALSSSPEDVIAEVDRSGLRGRGGAGFPTGRKWSFARAAKGDQKYVICNADEGDPGAFMDRSVLESDPYAVLEGMLIAGYAIGATRSYVYCRAEYPLALERLRVAIQQLTDAQLLGDNILGSGHCFQVEVKEGAGAFVCGEETALMASIEGRRGMPRVRPPFPAQSGLFGKPTNINNVETFANVPAILRKGASWYRGYGTASSSGTKAFALAGKIVRTGLVEVPMGITLREIVFDVGGGVPDGEKFKAVQTGGPSGGCLPESCLDLTVDYETLAKAGSIMGSGGMIVMDGKTCIPGIARYFLSFTKAESCGKCAPCRLGTWQMKAILDDICAGKATEADVALLEQIADAVKLSALCGLGQTAPNPVLSTLRYFRPEYDAHIKDRRCPARRCAALVTYSIDAQNCTGCGACKRVCPSEAIAGEKKKLHVVDQKACIRCGACMEKCRFDAISVR